jgi:hypothetical protein
MSYPPKTKEIKKTKSKKPKLNQKKIKPYLILTEETMKASKEIPVQSSASNTYNGQKLENAPYTYNNVTGPASESPIDNEEEKTTTLGSSVLPQTTNLVSI